MPINSEKYRSTASKGNVASNSLKTTIALNSMLLIIDKVLPLLEEKLSQDDLQFVKHHIKEIKRCSKDLEKQFDDLAGWTADE